MSRVEAVVLVPQVFTLCTHNMSHFRKLTRKQKIRINSITACYLIFNDDNCPTFCGGEELSAGHVKDRKRK